MFCLFVCFVCFYLFIFYLFENWIDRDGDEKLKIWQESQIVQSNLEKNNQRIMEENQRKKIENYKK